MDFISPLLSVIHDYILGPATQHLYYAMHGKSKMVKLGGWLDCVILILESTEFLCLRS